MLLYLQKMEGSMLCTAAQESANEQVRNHVTGLLVKTLQNQKNLFNMMNSKGWYKTEPAPQDQFMKTQQNFQQMHPQMQ